MYYIMLIICVAYMYMYKRAALQVITRSLHRYNYHDRSRGTDWTVSAKRQERRNEKSFIYNHIEETTKHAAIKLSTGRLTVLKFTFALYSLPPSALYVECRKGQQSSMDSCRDNRR